MGLDINTKVLKKNAFRIAKERGVGGSRIRIPGGHLSVEVMRLVAELAETYGNGCIHITNRQAFEIEGIPLEDLDEVRKKLQPIIEKTEVNQPDGDGSGYRSAGTGNISACIGSDVCPYANYNTSELAKKIEKAVYPNDRFVKIGLAGCSVDCAKARLQDFGIIGQTLPQYNLERCVGCNACVKACAGMSVSALRMENYKILRKEEKCIGCGVCVTKCPTRAWTRSQKKYYKLVIMGRTGRKNPRLGEDFLVWADEENIIKIILNTYKFINQYVTPPGVEHIGYIIDRVGFEEFKKWALEGVELMPETIMKDTVYWSGIHFK